MDIGVCVLCFSLASSYLCVALAQSVLNHPRGVFLVIFLLFKQPEWGLFASIGYS